MNKKLPDRAWDEFQIDTWPAQSLPNFTVHDEQAKETGLLDEHGNKIMKSKPRIGFVR